jgi:hypothetical protein
MCLGTLRYLGPKDLAIYFIRDVTIREVTVEAEWKGVEVTIVLGRRILGVFLTTYLPTMLLVLIVRCTHWFKSIYFEGIATVNLTCTSCQIFS